MADIGWIPVKHFFLFYKSPSFSSWAISSGWECLPRNKELGGDGVGVVELGGDWGRGQTLIGRTLLKRICKLGTIHTQHNIWIFFNVKEEQEEKGDHLTWLGVVEVETGAEPNVYGP